MAHAYLVEGCEGYPDSQWDVRKTPGNKPGAELSFKDFLCQQLRDNVSIAILLLIIIIYDRILKDEIVS